MRKAILGAATALALASPAMAADLVVPGYDYGYGYTYREVPHYQPYAYGYRTAPVVIEESAPVVVVRRPVVIAPLTVVDDTYEYPRYVAPRVYAAPVYAAAPVYGYAAPAWRGGWGYRRAYYGRW